MSFGFSVSDIVLLSQLTWSAIKGSRKACGEYDALTREVSALHAITKRLEQEFQTPESPLNMETSASDCKQELRNIVTDCEKVLRMLNKILDKYNALSEKERSGRKLWQRVRFGSGEMADVGDLRSKIILYTSSFTFYLNMISMGTVGRIEQEMNNSSGMIREIQLAVNGITTKFMSRNNYEGSVFTNHADDDKSVWREFRRELRLDGFTSSTIHKHKHLILAYIKELGDRGILDDQAQGTDLERHGFERESGAMTSSGLDVSSSNEPSERDIPAPSFSTSIDTLRYDSPIQCGPAAEKESSPNIETAAVQAAGPTLRDSDSNDNSELEDSPEIPDIIKDQFKETRVVVGTTRAASINERDGEQYEKSQVQQLPPKDDAQGENVREDNAAMSIERKRKYLFESGRKDANGDPHKDYNYFFQTASAIASDPIRLSSEKMNNPKEHCGQMLLFGEMTHASPSNVDIPDELSGGNGKLKPRITFIPNLELSYENVTFENGTYTYYTFINSPVVYVGRDCRSEMNQDGAGVNKRLPIVHIRSEAVNRFHCSFLYSREGWFIMDYGSNSGTFLNGTRLSPQDVMSDPYPVHNGDMVQIGSGEGKLIKCAKFVIGCGHYEKDVSFGRLDKISHRLEMFIIPQCLQLLNYLPGDSETRDSEVRELNEYIVEKIVDELDQISESDDARFNDTKRDFRSKAEAWQTVLRSFKKSRYLARPKDGDLWRDLKGYPDFVSET